MEISGPTMLFLAFSPLLLVPQVTFGSSNCPDTILQKAKEWNPTGAPTTGKLDDIAVAAAECSAVLGPLPTSVDCSKAKKVPHLDPKISSMLESPDPNPKNLRISVQEIGPVKWVLLCEQVPDRWNIRQPEQGDPYSLNALIGWNPITGESCFFKSGEPFPVTGPHPGPGSPQGVRDHARKVPDYMPFPDDFGLRAWQHPDRANFGLPDKDKAPIGARGDTCVSCHSKNYPFLVSKYLNQSRVGGDGKMDVVPEDPRKDQPGAGYRVIGTSVNQQWKHIQPRTVQPKLPNGKPDKTCTRCHVISSDPDYLRLCEKSVGYPASQFAPRREIAAFMPLGVDPHDSHKQVRNWRAVEALKYCAEYPEDFKKCMPGKPLLSSCPVPDPIVQNRAAITHEKDKTKGLTTKITWNYQDRYNQKSQVKERDDIRFNLEILGKDGMRCQINDIKPKKIASADWEIQLPSDPSYSISLTPVRYCFDNTGTTKGTTVVITATPVPSSQPNDLPANAH